MSVSNKTYININNMTLNQPQYIQQQHNHKSISNKLQTGPHINFNISQKNFRKGNFGQSKNDKKNYSFQPLQNIAINKSVDLNNVNKESFKRLQNTLQTLAQNNFETKKCQDETQKVEKQIYLNVNIYYKQIHKIKAKINISNLSTKQLFKELVQNISKFEKENLDNDSENINKIICFTSANNNLAISHFLQLENRSLDILENSTINLFPLYKEIISHNQFDQVTLQHFKLIKCIGQGGFSRVYLVQQKSNGRMFALKLIDKSFIIKNKKEGIVQNERDILTIVNHPFLLKLEYAIESNKFLAFIMEYCAGGELFFHLKKVKRMTESQARFYFAEILLGIQYLHEKHIIYRDIKPENIFMDIDGHVRIGDFGLCKPQMNKNTYAHSFCGSPEYMAPEMLLKVGHSYCVDYYCLGALLYELITGLPPYYSVNTGEIYESILSEELSFPENLNITNELKNLLQGLLCKNPTQRLGAKGGIKQIQQHKWFNKVDFTLIRDKQVKPPIIPDILQFNFDEGEFMKDEKIFRKQIIENQENNDQFQKNIYKEFYFDRNKGCNRVLFGIQDIKSKQRPQVNSLNNGHIKVSSQSKDLGIYKQLQSVKVGNSVSIRNNIKKRIRQRTEDRGKNFHEHYSIGGIKKIRAQMIQNSSLNGKNNLNTKNFNKVPKSPLINTKINHYTPSRKL